MKKLLLVLVLLLVIEPSAFAQTGTPQTVYVYPDGTIKNTTDFKYKPGKLKVCDANGNNCVAVDASLAAKQPLDPDLTSWATIVRAAGFDAFTVTPTAANFNLLLSDGDFSLSTHTHTGATVSGLDISDDTNLAGTPSEITLANDTLSLHAAITRDEEWNTLTEIETATGANIIQSTEIDTAAEINVLTTDADFSLSDHTHTGVTISNLDISDDTNLAGTPSEIILTDDTLSLHGTITRDEEWNTLAKIETATGANIIQSTEIDTAAEINALTTDADFSLSDHTHTGATISNLDISDDTNLAGTPNEIILTDDTLSLHAAITRDEEWNTLAEIETVTAANIIQSTEIDTANELNALLSDADMATLAGPETLSGKTLTAPKFADLGFIADANGNEILVFDAVPSAVNEVVVANSITGNRPVITASGADANIGLSINPKGTGNIVINSTTVPASKTLVVTTDKLSVLAATSSSELAGVLSDESGDGGGFVRANNPAFVTPALGTPASGNASNLTNIPVNQATGTLPVANGGTGDTGTAWTAYTPTVTAGTGAITSYTVNSAAYKAIGKTVFIRVDVTITDVGTAGSDIRITLPIDNIWPSGRQTLTAIEDGVNGASLRVVLDNNLKIRIKKYDNTFFAANGYRYVVNGVYEGQ